MSVCSSCSGGVTHPSQRTVYASQGSYQTLVYDSCMQCGGSGSIKGRDPNQNPASMGFIDSLSAIITLAISLLICWNISETATYSELSMNGKFILMVVIFIFSFFWYSSNLYITACSKTDELYCRSSRTFCRFDNLGMP